MIKLSILIPTTSARAEVIKPLLVDLRSQMLIANLLGGQVELIIDNHESDKVGTKRNRLLSMASGEYIVFVDSDDLVSASYISQILRATITQPDCIGISGVITTNGIGERPWHISKDFQMWFERSGVYYRTPNHISPVKRELALLAGFPEISFSEDYEYSMRLLPLLKTEVKIPGTLYYYRYESKQM